MEDILSFVSQRIRMDENLTMKDLPDICGLSKSKFYRCMAEPVRFTDEQLASISDALNLNDGERSRLFSYKHSSPAPEKNRLNQLFHKILFDSPTITADRTSPIYTIYRAESTQPEIIRCSATDLAQQLQTHLISNPTNCSSFAPEFNVTLFNTYAPRKVLAVFSLLRCLYDIDHLGEYYNISIQHLVNIEEDDSLEDRLDIFSNIYPLSAFGSYSVRFMDLKASPWETTDCCIIDYTSAPSGEKRYIFSLIPSETDIILYSFTQKIHFDFLSHNFFRYADHDSVKPLSNNVLSISQHFIDTLSHHKKILIDFEPCFENLLPSLWEEKKREIASSEEMLAAVRKATDPRKLLREYTSQEYIDILFSYCIKRVLQNEKAESINLISAPGLREFALTGHTTEMSQTGICLSPEQVVRQLEYVKSQLGEKAQPGQQSYYLIDPLCQFKKLAFQIFRDHKIGTYFNDNPMLVLSWKVLPDAKMATAFYDYVVTQLLPAEKRSEAGFLIMSDQKAEQHIDRLIHEVKERHKEQTASE